MAEVILIIDDDVEVLELVTLVLEREGYQVIRAASGQHGLRQAFIHRPNLILLDVTMPDMDGWEVCRRLRDLSDVPIVFLSARGATDDIIKGLDLGADDYLTKPFSNAELIARIRVHLRRAPALDRASEVAFGTIELKISFDKREVYMRGQKIDLSPKEFDLLAALVRNSERVMTHEELVAEAWGPEGSQALDHLKLYILYLRRKLERNPRQPELILTARGVGYRFNAPI